MGAGGKLPAAIGRLTLKAAAAVRTLLVRLGKVAGLAVAAAAILIVLDVLLLGRPEGKGRGS